VVNDFQIVESPRRVVALEDEIGELLDTEEDDWESVYAEEAQRMQRRTYSDVVRGNKEWA
jgi:hypothetical protein